jgi:hypothetical protein
MRSAGGNIRDDARGHPRAVKMRIHQDGDKSVAAEKFELHR